MLVRGSSPCHRVTKEDFATYARKAPQQAGSSLGLGGLGSLDRRVAGVCAGQLIEIVSLLVDPPAGAPTRVPLAGSTISLTIEADDVRSGDAPVCCPVMWWIR
jgi:hypothetical protein